MINYFDYIAEAAEEDIEDVDIVYNEMDATLTEFNVFVQEGVGLKILIGVGIAAALAGLIALIVKLFSKKNGKGAAAKTAQTKNLLNIARQNGVTSFTVNLPKGIEIDKAADNTIAIVNNYAQYVGKYVELLKKTAEGMEGKQVTSEEMLGALKGIGEEAIKDFPQLKDVIAGGKAAVDSIEVLSADAIKSKTKEKAHAIAQQFPVEKATDLVNKYAEVVKNLLKDGKEADQGRGMLNKFLAKTGIKGKVQDKTFEMVTAKITQIVQSAYDTIDDKCDKICDGVLKVLEEQAPEVSEKLKTGGKLSAFFGPAMNDAKKLKSKVDARRNSAPGSIVGPGEEFDYGV